MSTGKTVVTQTSLPKLKKPDYCPVCKSSDIIQTVYDLPNLESVEECQKTGSAQPDCPHLNGLPDWYCCGCKFEWYDISDPNKIDIIRFFTNLYNQGDAEKMVLLKEIEKARQLKDDFHLRSMKTKGY